MKQRCKNPKTINYHLYGGKGVRVCDQWVTFSGFFKDMGDEYRDDLTLDRIDGDGDYKKSNCRWATRQVQSINQKRRSYFKSKHVGVSWDNTRQKWQGMIQINGHKKYLGRFDDENECAKIVKSEREKVLNKLGLGCKL